MTRSKALRVGKTSAERERLARRLWAQVEKTDDCWIWTGYLRNGHHGSLWHRGQNVYVHRLSYELHHGPIPQGMCVCHHCDTPPCVRPDHLFLGTQADNVADMEAKGRDRKVAPTGLDHGNAYLTTEQVEEIRRRVAGGEQQRDVAERFGCSQSTVWRIAHRKTRAAG